MAAMRNWLNGQSKDPEKHRVAVVHCKAGKGRSGTVSCSYLISQEGWKREDALKRFTTRRMRAGFGNGVSIPSQLRWVGYVDRWTNQMHKQYVERPVEIVEIHIWGLRAGVKVSVEGFIEDGKRIKNFHTFVREEKINVDRSFNHTEPKTDPPSKANTETLVSPTVGTPVSSNHDLPTSQSEAQMEARQNVILKASTPIRLETSDINIDFERRNKSTYTGFTMVTSIAHVWFNAFFEGGFEGNASGVFEIEWDAMDGIKGSARKGIKALDRLKVIWRYAEDAQSKPIDEPKEGEPVTEGVPSDWRGGSDPEKEVGKEHAGGIDSGRVGATKITLSEMSQEAVSQLLGRDTGLRKSTVDSANISQASSMKDVDMQDLTQVKSTEIKKAEAEETEDEGTRTHGLDDADDKEEAAKHQSHESHDIDRQDTAIGKMLEVGIAKMAMLVSKFH